ncbi:glutaredoxin family protein [Denitrificimonas caeni]|uniref:Glutaredoxin family protein n=1 Tax=Denitrificimonas caeni TaxID=521720 RepID=A0AAE9VLN7_9GAMM|nr:glutaredoxin family protein [Denitrificimonas caeni]NLJ13368.1 glutaredoxin family protein [Gammaproteobacteria bacterium]WBE24441.1 glutaredoxin family protein [Denitrificimonas caeni]
MQAHCQLFGTLGCHLCDEAEQVLQPFVAQGLIVELLDIIDSADWLERYALTIPVLRRVDNGQELNWPFDEQDVLQLFT